MYLSSHIVLKCLQTSQKKKVIVFSSIFGWKARSKGNSISKEDYPSRKAIDSTAMELESMTLGLSTLNSSITGCVVSCGVIYGMGEQSLFPNFKQALEQKENLRIYGRGNNYVPTIHVDDLAQLAFDLDHDDGNGLHLAVDHSNITQRELVEAISQTIGSGQVDQVPIEDGFLEDNFDMLAADIVVDPSSLPKISAWKYRGGLIANMGAVVGEFNNSRGLRPNKIIIHGPPVSGKSQLAQQYSFFYSVSAKTMDCLC